MNVIAIIIGAYLAIVVGFESLIGVLQPAGGDTLVITTMDEDGNASDRVLSRLESSGQLYVASNHWPRGWYNQALENPNVEIVIGGERSARLAVPVTGEEHDQVDGEHSRGLVFRFLTGFPPRKILRLDAPAPAGD